MLSGRYAVMSSPDNTSPSVIGYNTHITTFWLHVPSGPRPDKLTNMAAAVVWTINSMINTTESDRLHMGRSCLVCLVFQLLCHTLTLIRAIGAILHLSVGTNIDFLVKALPGNVASEFTPGLGQGNTGSM